MKKPKPGKLPLPHIQYTQDALGRIGHDIERRKRAGEKFPTTDAPRDASRYQFHWQHNRPAHGESRTGAAAICTSPLPSGRASQRSPSPPQRPVKQGSGCRNKRSGVVQ